MSKIIQAASAIALAAATSSAFAWYGAPLCQPVVAPTQEQQQAMMEQHDQAIQEAFAARAHLAEQQTVNFGQFQPQHPGRHCFAQQPFAAMPPMPELGAHPEMPAMPEFGQYPSMPKMAFPSVPDSMQERIKEMDAYRAESLKRMEERRAAMQDMREQRRAIYPSHHFEHRMHNATPGWSMPATPCAAAPQQQAAAPTEQATTTQ